MKALFQQRLAAQRVLIGLLQTHHDPTLAEMAGMRGYDFLVLDGEHGVFSDHDYLEAMRTLAGVETLAMIRLDQCFYR
jgi:2-keto-3-deoxy-L-rhamnonate aldolase RhmA